MNASHAPQPGSGETPGQEARLASSMGTLAALRIDQQGPGAGAPVGEPVSARGSWGSTSAPRPSKSSSCAGRPTAGGGPAARHSSTGETRPTPRPSSGRIRLVHPDGAAVSGRLGRQVRLPRVPTKQAQARAYRFLFGDDPATVVSIGSHGFSVLELRANGIEVFRENTRCSQGTGNFLRQLVERFDLDRRGGERAVRRRRRIPRRSPAAARSSSRPT